jgi:DNA sulfur modification protein DndD
LNKHDGNKAIRFSEACEQAKATLTTFRKTVVTENAHRIEERIWDRFKQLLRKKKLGCGVKINPENYTLSLIDSTGKITPPERLSAGERQLLATAMLWGLADSTSRQLPVIIDTPLGRLDRDHRSNLVSEYFPNASSQVVLLSTDEEIDERWLPVLEPSIARMYLIDFNDEDQCSKVIEGYFKMELANA